MGRKKVVKPPLNELIEQLSSAIKMRDSRIQNVIRESLYLIYGQDKRDASASDAVSQWKSLLLARKMVIDSSEALDLLMREFRYRPYADKIMEDGLFESVIFHEERYYQKLKKHPKAQEITLSDDAVDFLRTPLNKLPLRPYAINVLKSADCEIMYDIIIYNKIELLKLRGVGINTIAVLENLVKPYGLHLGLHIRFDISSLEYRTLQLK